MLVLKLVEALDPALVPCTVGARLGDGADGEVFEIVGDPDKVIKFCVLYDTGSIKLENRYNYICRVVYHLLQNPSPVFARVYAHKFLGESSRIAWGNHRQRYFLYYYSMEKLHKISDDERKVFDTIVSHEDRNKRKNFSLDKIKEMLSGLSHGLDFDVSKVIFFCDNFRKSPVTHLDIHPRNVMKDSAGNFKLIDFDRAEISHGKEFKKG